MCSGSFKRQSRSIFHRQQRDQKLTESQSVITGITTYVDHRRFASTLPTDHCHLKVCSNTVFQRVDQASCLWAGSLFAFLVRSPLNTNEQFKVADRSSDVRCSWNGRDCFCSPDKWRTLFLGCHLSSSRSSGVLVLDYRLVSANNSLQARSWTSFL